ncbi:hypothetical protein VSR69_43480 [Paraburkholderia phytofirmans]
MALSTIQKIDRLSVDCDLAHQVVHGAADATVQTEGGAIPTMANAVATLKAYNVRGDWVAGMTLAMKDIVVAGGVAYVALSSAEFVSNDIAADLAAGRIGVHQGATVEDLANPDKGVRMVAHAVDDRDLASPDAGKGVAMVAHAVDDRVLAGDGGAALIGFLAAGDAAVRQTLAAILDESVSVARYGSDPSGVADSTKAFKAAIARVTALVTAQGSPYPAPVIDLPPGVYKLSDTLNLLPWHRMRSKGVVLLDFRALDVVKDGIVMRNEQKAILMGDAKWASVAPFLDGSAGSIVVLGPGKATSTGWGVRVGNTTTESSDVRDTGGRNVIVTGWRGALRYDPINLYLITWERSRFEQNGSENLYVSSATPVVNSGERMAFNDCTFAAANNAVYHNCDGYSYEFNGCSFDYHATPFRIDTLGRYSRFLFKGGHSEAFDGLWFDATASGERVELTMQGHEILPTHYVDTSVIASPRKLIDGNAANRVRLAAFGTSLRYLWRPYLADTPIVGDNVLIHALDGTIQEGYYGVLTRSRSLIRDYDFLANAIGTSADALTNWTRDPGLVDVDVRDIQTTPSLGQSLHLHGTSANSTITLHSNDSIPCKPGETYCAGCDVFANGTTGDLNVRVFMRCYDTSGTQVGADLGATYKMADAYADPVLPNRAAGRNRAMGIDHRIQTIPPYATSFRLYATVSSFVGDVYVKNVRAFRA